MTKRESNISEGIDESVVFQHLWRKKIVILVVTVLCLLLGTAHVRLRPQPYMVTDSITLTRGNADYMNRFFRYGKIDFSLYPETGRIETGDSLRFTAEEQALLYRLRHRVTFVVNYPDTCVSLRARGTDTVLLLREINDAAELLQRRMSPLAATFFRREADSLGDECRKVENRLRDSLARRMEVLGRMRNSPGPDADLERMYLQYECDNMALFSFGWINHLRNCEKTLRRMKFVAAPPRTEVAPFELGGRSLWVRWGVFGFLASCLGVLGLAYFKGWKR